MNMGVSVLIFVYLVAVMELVKSCVRINSRFVHLLYIFLHVDACRFNCVPDTGGKWCKCEYLGQQ